MYGKPVRDLFEGQKLSANEASERLHEIADQNGGRINIYKFARSLGIIVTDDHDTCTTKEQPALMKYDDSLEEFEMFVNVHARPKQKREAISHIVGQFILDKDVIVQAGVFPPVAEQKAPAA